MDVKRGFMARVERGSGESNKIRKMNWNHCKSRDAPETAQKAKASDDQVPGGEFPDGKVLWK